MRQEYDRGELRNRNTDGRREEATEFRYGPSDGAAVVPEREYRNRNTDGRRAEASAFRFGSSDGAANGPDRLRLRSQQQQFNPQECW